MYDGGSGDPRRLVSFARQTEDLGYDSVWIGDSLLAKPRADPLTLLAAVAAATETVTIGTAVLIASQRNPEQLAQAVATVDALSDGRLVLGVGAGPGAPNVRADHEFVGANFDRRSSRMIEVIERCRSLWTGADGVQMYPLPGRAGGPPVWIGGEGPKTLERTGHLADGWFPISADVDKFATRLATVCESVEAAGRRPGDLAIGLYVHRRNSRRRGRATRAQPAVLRPPPRHDQQGPGFSGRTDRCGRRMDTGVHRRGSRAPLRPLCVS